MHEEYAIKIPDISADIPESNIAPILCAGVTMWSPLINHGCMEGKKKVIGIVGIGGLGTMGIKLARSMGHTVVAFTRSKDKENTCLKKGAHEVCITSDPESTAQ